VQVHRQVYRQVGDVRPRIGYGLFNAVIERRHKYHASCSLGNYRTWADAAGWADAGTAVLEAASDRRSGSFLYYNAKGTHARALSDAVAQVVVAAAVARRGAACTEVELLEALVDELTGEEGGLDQPTTLVVVSKAATAARDYSLLPQFADVLELRGGGRAVPVFASMEAFTAVLEEAARDVGVGGALGLSPPGAEGALLLDYTRFRELDSLTPEALGVAAPPREAGIYFWLVALADGRRELFYVGESGGDMLARFSSFVGFPHNKLIWPTYALSKGHKVVYSFVSLKTAWLAGGERRKRSTPPAATFKELAKKMESWFLARFLTAANHMENGGCCSFSAF